MENNQNRNHRCKSRSKSSARYSTVLVPCVDKPQPQTSICAKDLSRLKKIKEWKKKGAANNREIRIDVTNELRNNWTSLEPHTDCLTSFTLLAFLPFPPSSASESRIKRKLQYHDIIDLIPWGDFIRDYYTHSSSSCVCGTLQSDEVKKSLFYVCRPS